MRSGSMSVGDGFMIAMPAAPTDTTTAVSGDVGVPRRRGKSKAPNFAYSGPVSVIRLELDVSDEPTHRRLERHWGAVFRLRRALQRDAQTRCRAYWAAHRERQHDRKALRARLGLSRKGMEAAAKRHVEASGWMRDHLTKAIGLHVADEVWATVDRHLFADSSGRVTDCRGPARGGISPASRDGPARTPRPHPPGKPTGWSAPCTGTWPPTGTPGCPPRSPPAPPQLAGWRARRFLPSPLGPVPARPASSSWWGHDGPLAVVFTGLPAGDVVLPVRLPQGAGQWAHLGHFLSDPSVWHKIDLVRVRDRKAPGGWRYYAHLLIHHSGYQSPDTRTRRAEIPAARRAGVDANVSNLSLASFPNDQPRELVIDQIGCTPEQQHTAARAVKSPRSTRRWIGRGITPTPTSTARQCASSSACNAASRKG